MPVLRHARLVLPDGVVENGWLCTEGERISALGGPAHLPPPGPDGTEHDL